MSLAGPGHLAMPELAVLSALVHGDEPDAEPLLEATVHALARLDDPVARSYLDLVFSTLGHLARAALEALMPIANYEYKSDFAKKYVAQGREEGREEGRVLALRDHLLAALATRKLGPSERARTLVATTSSPELLERWCLAVLTAATEDDVFSEAQVR